MLPGPGVRHTDGDGEGDCLRNGELTPAISDFLHLASAAIIPLVMSLSIDSAILGEGDRANFSRRWKIVCSTQYLWRASMYLTREGRDFDWSRRCELDTIGEFRLPNRRCSFQSTNKVLRDICRYR